LTPGAPRGNRFSWKAPVLDHQPMPCTSYNSCVASLRRFGLLSLFEIYEYLKVVDYKTWRRNRHHLRTFPSDGFPIPPLKLRLKVAGTADLHAFFHGGERAAASVRDNLARHGVEMHRLNGILDFG
jgi:hypothetical protein